VTHSDPSLLDRVRDAWLEVLDVPQIGLDDAFFDAGGDSILLILLLERLNELAGDRLEAADLFQHSTIRAQAALIAGDQPVQIPEPVVRGPGDRAALLGRARRSAS